MENIHIIDIEKRKQQFKKRLETTPACDVQYINDSYTMLINLEEKINQELTNDTYTKLHLGCYLKDIKEKYLYKFAKYTTFEEYCDSEIGISRKYAYTLIKIYEWTKCLDVETFDYHKFTISQLQEILYLPKDQLKEVDLTMTIQQIRALKNAPQTIDELKQNIKTDKEALLKVKNFDYDNDNYDFNYFTKFSRPDLAIIAFELYSRLKASRSPKTKKETKDGIINIASVQKQVNSD